jgi:hypothetical protein
MKTCARCGESISDFTRRRLPKDERAAALASLESVSLHEAREWCAQLRGHALVWLPGIGCDA